MVWVILIIIMCCGIFGGWGILVGVGIFIFVGLLGIAEENEKSEKRSQMQAKNRTNIVNADPRIFKATKSIENTKASDYSVYVDEISQKIMFVNFVLGSKQIYGFNEIVECSILEDGAAVQTGGVGRAVAGGLIAGDVGAIVGASTRKTKPVVYCLTIRVITTNMKRPLYEIPLITAKTDKELDSYKEKSKFAQQVYAVVTSAAAIASRQQIRK